MTPMCLNCGGSLASTDLKTMICKTCRDAYEREEREAMSHQNAIDVFLDGNVCPHCGVRATFEVMRDGTTLARWPCKHSRWWGDEE